MALGMPAPPNPNLGPTLPPPLASAEINVKARKQLHPESTCSVCEETVKAIIATGAGAGCGAACAASGCEPCIPFCSAICAEIAGGETSEQAICHAVHLC